MTTTLGEVVTDLAAEYAELDGIVSAVDDAGWELPTPAAGWTVGDQVGHLAFSDARAREALADPGGFEASRGDDVDRAISRSVESSRSLRRDAVLTRWRDERSAVLALLASADPARRVPWYGPPMGVVSFATARLMETWAHGQDVADALGVTRVPTARLRHIAHLGVRARPFSYLVRGIAAPSAPVSVSLTGPWGESWTWDTEGGPVDQVHGPALDFCLVVTQRRHVADTDLEVKGPRAREWLVIAQAFAGPPGPGRPRRGRG